MKKLSFLLIASLLFAFACGDDDKKDEKNDSATEVVKEDSSSDVKESTSKTTKTEAKFELEEAMVQYQMNIIVATVDMTTYFKDYGKVQASIMKTEMMGQKSEERELHKDGALYKLNMAEKTGDKIIMDNEDVADFDPMKFNFSDISDDIREKYKIKKLGKEPFLGKECTVYSTEAPEGSSKMWIWKNIPLKIQVSAQGMNIDLLTATRVDEKPTFPAGIFEIPAGFTIKEVKMEDMINEM